MRQRNSVQRDFDFVRLGEKRTITRGTPIEKLPDDPQAFVSWRQMIQKINEIIDRINKMNEVPA